MEQSEIPNYQGTMAFAMTRDGTSPQPGEEQGLKGRDAPRPTQRSAELHVRQTDEDKMTVRVTVASSRPLLRCGYWSPWLEQIELENADLSWLESGNAPLLDSHNHNKQIGIVRNPTLEPNGEYYDLVVDFAFFRDVAESNEAWQKVQSGFARNVSIGWTRGTGDVDEIQPDRENDLEYPLVVYREAQIIEVSLVAIPADHEVGIGREVSEDCIASIRSAKNQRGSNMPQPKKEQAKSSKDKTDEPTRQPDLEVDGGEKDPTPTAKREPTPDKEPKQETEPVRFDDSGQRWLSGNENRLKSIGVSEANIGKLRKIVDEAKEKDGISETQMQSKAWDMIDETDESRSKTGLGEAPAVHTGEHNFDLARVARLMAEVRQVDGYEGEIISEYQKQTKDWAPSRGGTSLFIPHSVLMHDPQVRSFILNSLGSAAAQDDRFREKYETAKRLYTVGATPSGFFHEQLDESIFAAALIAQARLLSKCTVLSEELVQDLATIREGASISTYWSTEQSTRAESTTQPTFTNRTFQWHQINCRANVHQRTLDQSRAFMGRLMEAMRRDIPRGIDLAMINGNPASNEPTGINRYTGLDTVVIGTNGGRPTWEHITQLMGTVEGNNAMNMDMWCFGMRAEIKQRLNSQGRYGATASTTGRDIPIIEGANGMEMINGYPVVTDNNIPTATKGSGTNTSAIIFGDFSSIEIAPFSGVEMVVDPWNGLETSRVDIYMRQALDILPRQVDCVATIPDARDA